MEKLPGRISSKEAIGNSGDLATSGQPNPGSGIPATLGRRGLLRAGLTSSLSLLTGLAIGGRTSVASQKDQESEKKLRCIASSTRIVIPGGSATTALE